MRIYKCERESRDCRPQFAGVDEGGWNGPFDSFDDFEGRVAGEEGLHAEEVGVEDGREDDLVYDYFGSEREDFRGVVKILV